MKAWPDYCAKPIDAAAYIRRVPADPALPALLQHCLSGAATRDEAQRSGAPWQERVRPILLGGDPQVFLLRRTHCVGHSRPNAAKMRAAKQRGGQE